LANAACRLASSSLESRTSCSTTLGSSAHVCRVGQAGRRLRGEV
jgi:hypothetical protein